MSIKDRSTKCKESRDDHLNIRPYRPGDKEAVIDLWLACNLVVSHNNPERDIERKLKVNPEWFLIGLMGDEIVATCMAGYEGHRGWINYLAVKPQLQRQGIAGKMMQAAEIRLLDAGCPKINLQVRNSNIKVIQFYKSIGYSDDDVIGFGKRLVPDKPYDGGTFEQKE
jgi:ribosomal protein S18 acetylase RimI-like enzyme